CLVCVCVCVCVCESETWRPSLCLNMEDRRVGLQTNTNSVINTPWWGVRTQLQSSNTNTHTHTHSHKLTYTNTLTQLCTHTITHILIIQRYSFWILIFCAFPFGLIFCAF